MTESAQTPKHSRIDDIQGLGLGVFLCGIGLHILTHVGLITGQTAGLAVIISYLSGWSFGAVFFVLNIPFYVLAYRRLGPAFTAKSLLSVTLLSVVTELLPHGWQMGTIEPWLGAVIAGCVTGVGLIVMFRHNGSLGGFGVLGLIIQDTTGFRAGYFQLIVDAILFGVAFFILPPHLVIWSLLGAVIINLSIAVNHRPDRYVAR
ncbi:YitT family protein [Loktanella sp. S4079]|uniref:YitT family protein n=1 Tax=Loktanella sp. S4079 TaxID=579483 RepID=UPI0005FA03AD|nr:YitT family protein [Loktanella sp. S4079]KJZ20040.1 hypothetical protein TW80_04115 [Loktanella sp. S4079]